MNNSNEVNVKQEKKIIRIAPIYFVLIINFLVIVFLLIYVIYLRFVPYMIMEYDGYGVSGKDIAQNLLNSTFDVEKNIKALKVSDNDEIYQNLRTFYLGASKKNSINLDYPIYVNDSIALYSLSQNSTLITSDFEEKDSYSKFTLTSGELYNSKDLQRADYNDYILMKTPDNLYINSKEIKIQTSFNTHIIPMNSIINFTKDFITYYSLEEDQFVYHNILDVELPSMVDFKDYNINCTYREFLEKLRIIDKEKPKDIIEEEKVEKESDQKEEKEIKKKETEKSKEDTTQETSNETSSTNTQTQQRYQQWNQQWNQNWNQQQNPQGEQQQEQQEEPVQEPEDTDSDSPNIKKWIKPTVSCEEFDVNTYSARTKVTIKDPSRVITNGVSFMFYKENEPRPCTVKATKTSGDVIVTKLLPDTNYRIVGLYQYTNREGKKLQNEFYEGKYKTKGTENLNSIDLSITNGPIYPTQIELTDIHIVSDIQDEAINGAESAYIVIDGIQKSLKSKDLFKGNVITYKTPKDSLESNKKYNYEIKIYDTAGNEMKVKDNTGSTSTSKKRPSVSVEVLKEKEDNESIKVRLSLNVDNKDKVELQNYKYVLYSSDGEIQKQENLSENTKKLTFPDLDPYSIYTIRLFADIDMDDGKGLLEDEEIGNATFSTNKISDLAPVYLNVNYQDNDITYDGINFNISINRDKTNNELMNLLKTVNLQLKYIDVNDNNKVKIAKEIEYTDIAKLCSDDGISTEIKGLESNTEYYFEFKSIAEQGNVREEVKTTCTKTSFKTNKKPAEVIIKNVVVTTNMIDMDVYILDKDDACIDKSIVMRMIGPEEKDLIPVIEPADIKSYEAIPTNYKDENGNMKFIRIRFEDLEKDAEYTLKCEAKSYNETFNKNNIQNNYLLRGEKFVTTGLEGKLELMGLVREKTEESKNLIDSTSEVNWYSKTFDTIDTVYTKDEVNNINYVKESKNNYGRTYTRDGNNITLKLLSNQCYVYNLSKYKGQTITISCSLKSSKANAKIYLQKGKKLGENIEEITGINTSNWRTYQKTLTVPEDGYVGFYLSPLIENEKPVDYNLEVKNLQAEIGNTATTYSPYTYLLNANFRLNYLDVNHKSFNDEEGVCKYYVRINSNVFDTREYGYNYEGTENIVKNYQYLIEENGVLSNYTFQLIMKQYGREYILSQVLFDYDPDKCTEIRSISTTEEYKEIQPYGNYIILEDLNLTNCRTKDEYTFGNPNIPFCGGIDYNGKTISKNTYSETRQDENRPYMFYKIDQKGKIKNVVIDYYINHPYNRYTTRVDGTDTTIFEEDGIYSLFLYNNGIIDNSFIKLKQSTEKQRVNVGLMGYKNSGTIDSFIIKYESTLYGSQYLSGLCMFSDGIIQNGYLYGITNERTGEIEGIEGIGNIVINDYRYISGVLYQIDGDGLLQNVFNIAPIRLNHYQQTNSYAANIVFNVGFPPTVNEQNIIIDPNNSTAKVKNVYSVKPVTTILNDESAEGLRDSSNKLLFIGPNIINKYTSTIVEGSRYFFKDTYEASEFNSKVPPASLYEPGVQDLILNAGGENKFIIDRFVANFLYPQLNLNYCMPKQDKIPIEKLESTLIDVLASKVIDDYDITKLDLKNQKLQDDAQNNFIDYFELKGIADEKIEGKTDDEKRAILDELIKEKLQDENTKIVEFRIFNPSGIDIKEISTEFVNSTIIIQSYAKKVTTMYAVLDTPTSYLNEYNILFVKGRNSTGRETISNYGEDTDLGIRNTKVRFVKHISTAEELIQINEEDENGISGLIQNYRLVGNIDLSGQTLEESQSAYITDSFSGFLDGEYDGKIHTISGLKGSLFGGFVKGTIQNLNVNDITINSSLVNTGLIEKASISDDITIDNVHINTMNVLSSYVGKEPHIGGLIGYLLSDKYSVANEIHIQNCSISDFNMKLDSNAEEIMCGGLIGYLVTYGDVKTYINNNFIQRLEIKADVKSASGVGGLIGYKTYNNDPLNRPGDPQFYINNCYTTGTINSEKFMGGILGFSRFSNCYISECYSSINMNSKMLSGEANIGGICGYSEGIESHIYNNLYVGNIYVAGNEVRNIKRILGNKEGTISYKNYAYKDQLINGERDTRPLGAELLSYDAVFDRSKYTILNFDNNYAYETIKNNQPYNLLENHNLPHLKDTYGNILPDQEFRDIVEDLKLLSIQTIELENKTKVDVTMEFENKNHCTIRNVIIENDDMTIIGNITQIDNGINTVIKFQAVPNRSYDSYKITQVVYLKDGDQKTQNISTKIKISLFKEIKNAFEWNDFFNGDGRTYPGQNVVITGNIDFGVTDDISKEVVIGRLEGAEGHRYIISNFDIEFSSGNKGFINEIKTSLKNINFNNCNIKATGSYVGLIAVCRGEVQDCNFSNINVYAKGYSYVGIIAQTISGSFNNINLKKVKCNGYSYVGGLSGQATSMSNSANIKGEYISITGGGNYAGGIFGYAQGNITNIEAYQYSANEQQTGDTQANYPYLVDGNTYVGGIIGAFSISGRTVSNATTKNSLIRGKGQIIGGNIGYIYGGANNLKSENNTITGTGTSGANRK